MTNTFRHTALSALAAVAVSATCVFAAVGPARAASAPVSRADWAHAVESRITNANDDGSSMLAPGAVAEAILTVRFDGAGALSDIALDRSTGYATLDAHALRVARKAAYPAMPAAMLGIPQAVTMRLVFGSSDSSIARYLASRPAAARTLYAGAARNAGGTVAE